MGVAYIGLYKFMYIKFSKTGTIPGASLAPQFRCLAAQTRVATACYCKRVSLDPSPRKGKAALRAEGQRKCVQETPGNKTRCSGQGVCGGQGCVWGARVCVGAKGVWGQGGRQDANMCRLYASTALISHPALLKCH